MRVIFCFLQSAAKCPMIPQLKHGPFGRHCGVDVWATCISLSYPCWYLAILAWYCLHGNWVRDTSIGTGWLFMCLGAFEELYCGLGFGVLCWYWFPRLKNCGLCC